MQKEAYILRVPCITLRENTEWVETVEEGGNVLVSANTEDILLNIKRDVPKSSFRNPLFGDGNAARQINKLLHSFND
jgi:UDP-N-acetylglucosamine 2-epimerase (non-hydrolysing)